jgi:hypothetical protein
MQNTLPLFRLMERAGTMGCCHVRSLILSSSFNKSRAGKTGRISVYPERNCHESLEIPMPVQRRDALTAIFFRAAIA